MIQAKSYPNKGPFKERACYDCKHLNTSLSLECGNKDAIEFRGTSEAGHHKCGFWEPDWNYIPPKYKTPVYGYISTGDKIIAWFKNLLK